MRKRPVGKRFESIFNTVKPQVWGELLALLTRIVGELVKDKLVRAILIGILGGLGSYAATVVDAPEASQPPPQTQTIQQDDKPPM